MTFLVPRTCTEIGEGGLPVESEQPDGDSIDWHKLLAGDESGVDPGCFLTLEDFRETDAYVLLGAPGAGKTTVFEAEGEREGCHCVTARDFLALGDRPEWRDTTLFIDGLDEMRAGSPDGRTPLDRIRAKIDALGRPRFRLSCREADWFGANDRTHLETISRDGKVKVLRLDPLSDSGVRDFLTHEAGIGDAEEFIATARERGIDSLLANPQSLLMLADAVAGGAWPKTRMQTFELACEKLVREPNAEHQIANADDPPADDLLDAAGRVCALQLICGLEGAALTDSAADEDFPAPERFGASAAALRRVLPSRLFERAKHGRRSPLHRNLAEFLAARHLAGLARDHNLPVRRVLALLTGADGGVVSPLRGLAAWFAAHCPAVRAEFIERDPEGVAAYGDPSVFTPNEKRRVVEGLRAMHHSLPAGRFMSLATPDMAPLFHEWLTDSAPDPETSSFATFVLCLLANAPPLPELRDVFFDLVENESRSPGTRQWAALCLAQGALAQPDKYRGVACRLLSGLKDGGIRDDDRSILGSLLQYLYPAFITPDEVFDYLHAEHGDSHPIDLTFGRYGRFWRHDLPGTTRSEDAAVVLDKMADIVERSREWKLAGEQPALVPARTAGALVKMALERADEQDTRRTLRWLKIAGADDDVDLETSRAICGWIEVRPERFKKLLREAAAQCLRATDVDACIRRAKQSLHGAAVPPDYGAWCLGEIERTGCSPNLAKFWFEEAWNALERDNGADGLTLEHLEAVAASDAQLAEVHDGLRYWDISDRHFETQRRHHQRTLERRREGEQELANWRREFRRYERALRENRCSAGVLDRIAEVYWGHYIDLQAGNGRERLRKLLGEDTLVEAAVEGLRGAIHRSDLPATAQVLALRRRDRRHSLALPVLAGLDLDAPDEFSRLEPDKARTAFAFLLADRRSFPEPGWLKPFVKSQPNLAADEIVRFATMQLRRGEHHVSFVHEISTIDWLSDVARVACPKLLRAFPVRAQRHMLDTLNRLIRCGLDNVDVSTMASIIARKLAARSMTLAQRAHWLAAQLVVSPQANLEIVESFVRKHENAMAGFFSFFERSFTRRLLSDHSSSRSLGRLARLLCVGRRPLSATRSASAQFRESDFVRALMEALGTRADDGAVSALTGLAGDPGTAAWHPTVQRIQQEQRVLRRNVCYQHPDIDAARRSLERRQPANAADLAALTMDVLTEISKNIRHGNTNDWRQYWNPDGGEQQGKPKDENDCRDALLSDLQYKLGLLGIDAVPEGHHAEGKRSDIRISYGGFIVPMEIKKSNHRDLWSAVRTQLIAKYSRDSSAGGYGIYLVFWFGRELCQPPEAGGRPHDAAGLEQRLRATLTPEEARLISICVIDVSRT